MSTPRTPFRRLVVAFTAALTACATQPSSVAPAYVSPIKYENVDCARLLREAEEIDARVRALTGTLKGKADTDAALVGVGLILFWPALLALPATGGRAEEAELARLKGEAIALSQALLAKDCDATLAVRPESAAVTAATAGPPAAQPAAQPAASAPAPRPEPAAAVFADWLKRPESRAFAISPSGGYGRSWSAASPDEASKAALRFCVDRHGDCTLYAVDGALVAPASR